MKLYFEGISLIRETDKVFAWESPTRKILFCEFSNTNATATIAKIDSNISTYLDSKDPQAEVLDEHHIPPEYIEDIIDDWKT